MLHTSTVDFPLLSVVIMLAEPAGRWNMTLLLCLLLSQVMSELTVHLTHVAVPGPLVGIVLKLLAPPPVGSGARGVGPGGGSALGTTPLFIFACKCQNRDARACF